MKVLLVNPTHKEAYSKVPSAEGVNPPLGLAYIASYLRENGIDVSLIDAAALDISHEELRKNMSEKEFDIIGVPSMTPSLNSSLNALEIAREINPRCKTVMGGNHISALPIETLTNYQIIDFGVLREGEITFLELVNALEKNQELSKVDGLVYRKDGIINVNPKRKFIENLDELPLPAYDLLPMDKYRLPAHHTSYSGNIKLKPFFLLFTSRGCPYDCTYCASKVIWERKVRYRSPENVLKEIDILVNKYGVKCLEIADDIFTINKQRLHAILDGLIERNYDLHFNCLSRVDTVDLESLKKMKKAGCYLIRFGVESGSQKILDRMKKNVKVEQIRNAFKLVNKANIASSASFIIGHPGETEETVNETIKIAKEINSDAALFFIAIPLVGTELFEIAKNQNLIVNKEWIHWKQVPEKPVMRTEELTVEDLLRLRKKAFKEFYFRPYYLMERLLKIRTIDQIKYYFNGLLAVLKISK